MAGTSKIDVGGQAVIEGVMMRSPRSFAVVCRRPGGEIVVKEDAWEPIWAGRRVVRWPIFRGGIVLLESLWNGLSALTWAADQQIVAETTPGFEAAPGPQAPGPQAPGPQAPGPQAPGQAPEPPPRSLGAAAAPPPAAPGELSKAAKVGMIAISMTFGIALFVMAPHLAAWAIGALVGYDASSFWFHLVDGVIKTIILVGYMAAISLLPDIRRVFQYHGAEHKAIATYEAGLPLTVENARQQSRFHPRCGTSFLLIVVMVSVVIFAALLRGRIVESTVVDHLIKIFVKIPLMLPIAGLAYEAIKLAGRTYERSAIARALSAPGLWLQKITTREPTDDQLEIACISIRKTLWRERQLAAGHAAPGGIEVFPSAAAVHLPLA